MRLDGAAVGRHLRDARIGLLVLAGLLINGMLVVRSLRWQILLAPMVTVSFRPLFAATSVGFGSIFIVGRVGEIIRPAVLSLQQRLSPSLTVASIVVERLFDMTAIVLLFSINLLLMTFPAEATGKLAQLTAMRTLGGALTLAIALGLGGLLLLRWRSPVVRAFLEKSCLPLAPRLLRPVLNFVYHLTDSLGVLTNRRALVTTTLTTCLIWGIGIGVVWLIGLAFGTPLTLPELIFVLGFGMVGSIVPTPGGSAGAFHAATAGGLEFLGFEPNLAASIAIVYHLIAFGPPFLLALYFLIRDDLPLGQLRQVLTREHTAPLPGGTPLSERGTSQ
jgi:uncharacterized protein (TIRG00374 family)